jgi:hypothetical protein
MKSYDFVDDFQNDFARVRKDDKYGYINKQGIEVVKPIYDNVYDLHEGFAIVKNNKWGYINKQGIEVIPLIYDEVWDFKDDFAVVQNNNKFGFIDKQGKEVIPCIYDHPAQADKELKKYIKKSFMESL